MLQNVERNAKSLNEHRELSWFAKQVLRGRAEIYSEIVTVTPSMAQHILENNPDNRTIKYGVVDQIASDIEGGRWQLNGEAIVVASDGSLNDGQHRLLACVEAKKPIQTMMVFGVARDSRLTVDMGISRTAGDFLAMQHVKNANNVATIVRLYDMFLRNNYYRKGLWQTKQYMLDFYRAHSNLIEYATTRSQNNYAKKVVGLPAYGLAFLLLHQVNADACEVFFQRLQDGANLPRNSPILALRTRLSTVKEERRYLHEVSALIIAHWNAWRKNTPVQRSLNIPKSWPKVER